MSDTGITLADWDDAADVVVVGTGVAGLSAALAANLRGRSVLLVEKGSLPGGTTAKSGGVMWLPNNPVMRAAGLSDPRPEALRYLSRVAYPTFYDPASPTLGLPEAKFRLLEAFYDHAAVAFEELTDINAIPFDSTTGLAYPDYHADLAEDAAPFGRAVRIRMPVDHDPAVDPTGGQLLVDRMLEVAEERGVRLRLEHRAAHLVRDESGGVVGLEAHVGRRTVLIGAQRGVVFCSGGFLQDPVLAGEFLKGRVFGGAAAATSTGDFLRIGSEVGAQLGNMSQAWWDEVALEHVLRTPSTVEDVWSPFGDSMIVVNRYGNRVMNEKMPYSERGPVHFNWDVDRREFPNLLLFMIYDDAVAQDPNPSKIRYPVPLPGDPADHVICGATWEELTAGIAARLTDLAACTGGFSLHESFPVRLRESVARFDELAADGVDLDHRRGETPIEKLWAPPARPGAANPTLFPFASVGPYHCIILAAGALDTKGGPVIDPQGRVLATDDVPIPGLYGAGNCIASPAGQAYWGSGGTIGPAMTFGHLAGSHVADEPLRWGS